MNARLLVLGGVILALLGLGSWAGLRRARPARAASAQAPLVVTTTAKQADLLLTITQTGAVAAKHATSVIPEISGRVAWVCANGILVQAGEEVLRLDPKALQEQLASLQVDYREAQLQAAQASAVSDSRMKEMRLQLRQAEDDVAAFARQRQLALRQQQDQLAFDANEVEKRREQVETQRRLAAKGLVPQTDVERQETALQAAEFALQKAKSDYELQQTQVAADTNQRARRVTNTNRDMSRTRGWTERDMRMSGNKVDNLKLQLDRAQEDLARTVLRAPASGLVMLSSLGGWVGDSHPPRLGDYVSQGREVAQIVNLDRLQVKIELDQTQITGVHMGQAAEVTIDALPGKVFSGKITSIGQNARRAPVQGWFGNSSAATFPVTVDLPPTGKALIRPGMRANVRIVVRTIKGAILVPTGGVFRHNGASVVYVDRGGRFVRTPVTVGESNGDYLAITRGLSAGARLALNDLGAGTPSRAEPPKESRRQ